MNNSTKTALVTGANKGIGLESARQLAEQGFTVWLGARDRARGEAAAERLAAAGDVRYVALDVTDSQSVMHAATTISQQTPVLDDLVNNAAIAGGDGEGLPSTVQDATIRENFEVNFYGALRVTQAFLPLLRKAPAGRIVNMSSTVGSLGTLTTPNTRLAPFASFAYPASKTLVNALTGWLAFELRDTAIKINSVCPGVVSTDMNGHLGTKQPSEAAQLVVHAATLPADGPSGTFFDADGPVAW